MNKCNVINFIILQFFSLSFFPHILIRLIKLRTFFQLKRLIINNSPFIHPTKGTITTKKETEWSLFPIFFNFQSFHNLPGFWEIITKSFIRIWQSNGGIKKKE